MHDVSDVERENPVVRAEVLHSEGAPGRDLELLLDLKLVHFFERLERDLKFLLFSHSILEVVSAIPEIELTDLRELLLDTDQLLHDGVRVEDLLLEDFDFVGDVVAAAAVGRRRAVATSLGDPALSVPTEGCLHA